MPGTDTTEMMRTWVKRYHSIMRLVKATPMTKLRIFHYTRFPIYPFVSARGVHGVSIFNGLSTIGTPL